MEFIFPGEKESWDPARKTINFPGAAKRDNGFLEYDPNILLAKLLLLQFNSVKSDKNLQYSKKEKKSSDASFFF